MTRVESALAANKQQATYNKRWWGRTWCVPTCWRRKIASRSPRSWSDESFGPIRASGRWNLFLPTSDQCCMSCPLLWPYEYRDARLLHFASVCIMTSLRLDRSILTEHRLDAWTSSRWYHSIYSYLLNSIMVKYLCLSWSGREPRDLRKRRYCYSEKIAQTNVILKATWYHTEEERYQGREK